MKQTPPRHESHLGVYALIVNSDTTQAMLIKKALGCYTGLYDLPGGTMEDGELLEETLQREVLEETDCTVTGHTALATHCVLYPFIKNDEQVILRHIGVIYLADISGTPRTHATGDDSDGCVWINIDDISTANSTPLVVMACDSWKKQRGA